MTGDKVRVTVTVDAPPAVAFELFTAETDLWWRRGPQYRIAGRAPGVIRFEPFEGGRLLEEVETPGGARVFECGRIVAWQPPGRLLFAWRAVNFAPGESTEVEVLFEPASGGRTRVTIEHRGWTAIRPDHPVRHGQPVDGFVQQMGLWWGGLATALRLHAENRGK